MKIQVTWISTFTQIAYIVTFTHWLFWSVTIGAKKQDIQRSAPAGQAGIVCLYRSRLLAVRHNRRIFKAIKLLLVCKIVLVKWKTKWEVMGSTKSSGSCRAVTDRCRCEPRCYWHLHALTHCAWGKMSCLPVYALNESWTIHSPDWADKISSIEQSVPPNKRPHLYLLRLTTVKMVNCDL